jgi:hypothetical protein
VLATAIPTSLLQELLTNPEAGANDLASILYESNKPAWFTALPTDIQDYLAIPQVSPTKTVTEDSAAMPTKAVAMGVMGAAGVIGLLAL